MLSFSKLTLSSKQLVNLQEFFSSPCILKLPPYQRQYSWEVPQLEDLWNDLFYLDLGKRYFFGSILLLQRNPDSEIPIGEGVSEILEIIDGQQRLATVMILTRVILAELKGLGRLDHDELETIERSVFKTGEIDKLILHGMDQEFFHNILEGRIVSGAEVTSASQKRLWIARNYFGEKLREQGKAFADAGSYEVFLRDLLRKAQGLEVARHIVDTDEEAVMIFESVNDRGIVLSPLDKSKSFLMRYLFLSSEPTRVELDLGRVNASFASIFTDIELSDDHRLRGQVRSHREFEKEIQRVHYVVYKAGATFFADAFASLKEAYLSMYRKDNRDRPASARAALEYAASLEAAFASMKKMLLYSEEDQTRYWLDRIFALNYGTYLPLLLSGWMTLEKRPEELVTLLRAIECLEFRYSSFRSRRSYTLLERIDARAFDLYHGNQDLEGILSSLTYLTKHYASDGAFRADLEGENFYFGSKAAMKLLFYEYECHLRAQHGAAMDIPLSTWMSGDYQIDHIWAQAALSGGADFSEYVENGHRGGNLAVVPSPTNVAMLNQNFSHKRNVYRGVGLYTLKEIAEAQHWGRREILKRTTELADFALRRWSLPQKTILERDLVTKSS